MEYVTLRYFYNQLNHRCGAHKVLLTNCAHIKTLNHEICICHQNVERANETAVGFKHITCNPLLTHTFHVMCVTV